LTCSDWFNRKKKQRKKRNSRVSELVNSETLYGSSSGLGGGLSTNSTSDTEGRSCCWVVNRPRAESMGATKPIAMGVVGRRTSYPSKSGSSPARNSPLMAALHSGGRYPPHGVHDSDNDDWRSRSNSDASMSRGSWTTRRMMQQEGMGSATGLAGSDATGFTVSQILGRSSPALALEADVVLRQPRGPDGTRGFKRDQGPRPGSGKS